MEEFFNHKQFLKALNKLPYGKNKTLEIMKEIKEKTPELTINVFICILHKRINPTGSSLDMGAGLYMNSVNIWNDYVYHNHKCDFQLLISHENLCF
jgi:hypothetical protein